jgi:hypothetical protein
MIFQVRRCGGAFSSAVAFVMVLAMIGCTSSSRNAPSTSATEAPGATAAPAAVINACDLFTAAIAKQFLGPNAKQTINAQPNKYMTHCQYTSDRGFISVMVSSRWDMISVGQENVPGEKPMAGLGDEAHINPTNLRVRKGTVGMSITATGPAGEYQGAAADAQLAQGEALSVNVAKALLPRL